MTPLYVASGRGNTVVVSHLLALKANSNEAVKGEFTALFAAAQNGHMGVVDALVTQGQADVNRRARDGSTPLYIAVQEGQMQAAGLLLGYRADPNLGTYEGFTPLIVAGPSCL